MGISIVLIIILQSSHLDVVNTGNEILDIILGCLIDIAAISISMIIATVCIFSLLIIRATDAPRKRKRACKHLRRFYGVCEPHLITKCYHADDKALIGRDLCLFFTDGALRITADLNYGFLNLEKDLGCYVIPCDEISVSKISYMHHDAAECHAEGHTFILGIRAEKYINEHLKG